MIVLHECLSNSQLGKTRLVVGLREKSARIAKHVRAQFPNFRKRRDYFSRVDEFLQCEEKLLPTPVFP